MRVEGTGKVHKKQVKPNDDGSFWLRLVLREEEASGRYRSYNVSYTVDSRRQTEMFEPGTLVDVTGEWEISRIKQADGVPAYYNFIKAENIKIHTDN